MSTSAFDRPSVSKEASLLSTETPDASIDPRKRKRRAIACLQCRRSKRRCIITSDDKCDGCMQDNVDCRQPETDGRKLRWQKHRGGALGVQDSDAELPPSSRLSSLDPRSQSTLATERSPVNDSPNDATYLDSLFDLIMRPTSPSSNSDQPSLADKSGRSVPLETTAQADLDGTMFAHDLGWTGLSHDTSPLDGFGLGPSRSGTELSMNQVRKVIWWRPHGPSAIAPGLQRITLKVRLDQVNGDVASSSFPQAHSSPGTGGDLVDMNGMPRQDIMLHLLEVFMTYFGCLFPALERKQLEDDMHSRAGSTLLFNCIACTASRFSSHPAIALPHLKPHSYGAVFLKTAKNLLGNMLAVPTRETVLALVLLAGISHGISMYFETFAEADSESEEWMFAGMAARMAIDLGLHLANQTANLSPNEERLNRLTFWSAYFLDISLAFGVGRQTAFPLSEITQVIPTEGDFTGQYQTGTPSSHAFIQAATLALSYGPMVNILNGSHHNRPNWKSELTRIIQDSVEIYNSLPQDMQWSAFKYVNSGHAERSLQTMSNSQQGAIFVQMHLWMHTMLVGWMWICSVQASDYLNDIHSNRDDPTAPLGVMTPGATATRLWQNSARTIGDILMLSSLMDPFAYHALPFSNQPLFVAGSCYIKEAEDQERQAAAVQAANNLVVPDADPRGPSNIRKAGMYVALLKSVTANNIAALRSGLLRQSKYWSGVAWVAEVLSQRWSGVKSEEIDLQTVTDGLDSSISVSDARLFGRQEHELVWDQGEGGNIPIPQAGDWLADTELLQSVGYDITTDNFTSDWASNYAK